MKKIIGIMVIFYLLLICLPLYWGLILLSGLIVGCTCIIIEKVEELRDELIDSRKPKTGNSIVD